MVIFIVQESSVPCARSRSCSGNALRLRDGDDVLSRLCTLYSMDAICYTQDTRHVDGPVPAGLALLFLAGEAGTYI